MKNPDQDGAAPEEIGIDTRAVHSGEPRKQPFSSLTTPVSLTATYTFESTAELSDYFEGRLDGRVEYGRYGNPTVDLAERKLAALDGAPAACLVSSGMAALATVLLAMLKTGQHVVITDECYRRTRQLVTETLGRFGVEHTVVPTGDVAAMEAAIRPRLTRLILSESPTNPYLGVVDLEALVEMAKRNRVKTLIDSTFATPINQRPFEYGVDLVVHSATKYLGGHNDLLAGSISGRAGMVQAIRELRDVIGCMLDPHSAYLLIRGLKTLHLRVERQNRSAMTLARWLDGHEKVQRVYYPGLESHPSHEIAKAQMTGYGGVVSFEIDGDLETTSRFIDACRLPRVAPSLGGVESLIEQQAMMSYYVFTTEEREAIGIKDNLVRMAVGVEDVEDLRSDLERAFSAI